ncbi:hypothetical protein F5B18DRAFT_604169 [Nemania serpens]|nr:hypothetical protein F5B18DRAFT_604169 [Nemania serpens]
MSQKITAKNLTYDDSLPPFLARLRGQQSARSGPDPILAAHRRPGQQRSASEEAEDAPVVVDEDGNVVYLKDGQLEGDSPRQDAKEKETSEGTHNDDDDDDEGDLARQRRDSEREKVAAIGASRKRKVGRVIGEEKSDDDSNKNDREKTDRARIAKASADVRRLREDEDAGAHRPRDHDGRIPARKRDARSKLPPPQQDGPQQKTIKSAKRKAAKKIKLSFGDDDGE